MAVEQIGKVGGCLVVEGFESEEEYFELNPLRDWEPVEFLEDGGDVVTGWVLVSRRAADFWM